MVELEVFLSKKGLLDQVPPFAPFGVEKASTSVVESGSLPMNPEMVIDPVLTRRNSTISEQESRSGDSEEGESMVKILRDLSLETNGGYIGATSQITMGRLVGSIVRGKNYGSREEFTFNNTSSLLETENTQNLRLSDIPADVADRLLKGFMKHICTRYPILHSAWIRDLHCRRNSITNAYERSTLHLIYATAGRFLETTGETSPSYFPERHHAEVLKDLDEMLRYHDTRSVVTLLLLAVFSLRAKGGPGACK